MCRSCKDFDKIAKEPWKTRFLAQKNAEDGMLRSFFFQSRAF